MHWMLVLAALFIASGGSAKEKAQIKYQTEAGFNLTRAAADGILARYEFKALLRTDYYVEIYDGERFWLIPNPERYKLRMQSYKDKWVVQANTKIAVHSAKCAEGWTFQPKEKAVGELRLSRSDQERFKQGVVDQLNLLPTGSRLEVGRSISKFNNFISNLDVPLLAKLKAVPTTPNWYFTASHQSKKVKWKTQLDMGLGAIEVALTYANDYVGDTFINDKYEMEFETVKEMSVTDFSESICRFVRQQNLSPEDLTPDRIDPQAETLRRLKRFGIDF